MPKFYNEYTGNHKEINDEDNGAIAFYIFKDNKDNIETYHIRASATPLSWTTPCRKARW